MIRAQKIFSFEFFFVELTSNYKEARDNLKQKMTKSNKCFNDEEYEGMDATL